ncbi:acetyltransferase [Williamsia phyllosphaerae]|uniref:Acetyltransferase n=1 Tax=Williamsia phyllosphaerae TaxID=885042 RepID=A0ABQ1UZR7_9NOCA|nr:acetyltransferase [Williamsia phyllosphaerae]
MDDDGPVPKLVQQVVASDFFPTTAQPVIDGPGGSILRPWESDDAAAVAAAYDDPAIQQWHSRRIDTLEESRAVIERWRSEWPNGSGAQWALADGDAGTLLGRVALRRIDLQDGNAEVAYWMVPAARGRGLCASAVDAMSRWAFDHAGLHRLHLEHSVANHASCRTAEKAGFVAEGTHRLSVPHADGWHDMHFHGRVSTDR